jgi:hypothetical protein
MTMALAICVADPFIRRMIYEIDRETKDLKMVARAKKLGSIKPQPAVRCANGTIACGIRNEQSSRG